MSIQYERLITFGPTISCHRRETWTPEVDSLYERLGNGDCSALAPLLAVDLEFVCDVKVFGALLRLKYDPDYPASAARRELRKIANVLTRRPSRGRGSLPHGDFLNAELSGLAGWLKKHKLLALKKDAKALEKRIVTLLSGCKPQREKLEGIFSVGVGWIDRNGTYVESPIPRPPQPTDQDRSSIARTCAALLHGVQPWGRYVRAERSWALNTLARLYGTETKLIEKRIARDPIVRAMRGVRSVRSHSR